MSLSSLEKTILSIKIYAEMDIASYHNLSLEYLRTYKIALGISDSKALRDRLTQSCIALEEHIRSCKDKAMNKIIEKADPCKNTQTIQKTIEEITDFYKNYRRLLNMRKETVLELKALEKKDRQSFI